METIFALYVIGNSAAMAYLLMQIVKNRKDIGTLHSSITSLQKLTDLQRQQLDLHNQSFAVQSERITGLNEAWVDQEKHAEAAAHLQASNNVYFARQIDLLTDAIDATNARITRQESKT